MKSELLGIFRVKVGHTGIPGLWTQELDAELLTLDSRR